jgi:hypothetical protein
MECEGLWVDWMWAISMHAGALHRIAWLISNADLDRQSVHHLSEALARPCPFFGGLITCTKVDLAYELDSLMRIPDPANASVVAEALFQYSFSRRTILAEDDMVEVPETDDRVQWLREKLHLVLDGHARAFDRTATARIFGRRCAEQAAACDAFRDQSLEAVAEALQGTPFQQELQHKAEAWPHVLRGGWYPIEAIGDTEEAEQYRKGMLEFIDDDPNLPNEMREHYRMPTDDDFAASRQELQAMENPVGWWFAYGNGLDMIGSSLGFIERERQRREELARQVAERLN